jgi:hypothetical protein
MDSPFVIDEAEEARVGRQRDLRPEDSSLRRVSDTGQRPDVMVDQPRFEILRFGM